MIARVLLPAFAVLSVFLGDGSRERTISAVEVKSLVVRVDRDLSTPLRASVERELAGLDLARAPKGSRYVLGVSLVKLDTSTSGASAKASCRVSLVLRNAKGGALQAFVDGTALAEDAASAPARAEDDAISGAVKGAMRAIPEVVAKLR